MALMIRPPHRLAKRRTSAARLTLQRLQDFLDQNTDEPAEILCSFWDDQKNAITYRELREAVSNGWLSQETFSDWQQDYSTLVPEKLAPIWQTAMQAGAAGQKVLTDLSFSLNTQAPGIMSWISSHGAEFVTSSTQVQQKAIQTLIGAKMTQRYTVDELARLIRPCIGLTDAQTKATMRLYDSVFSTLKTEHPKMKTDTARKKALDAAQKYAERKHRERAFTIAQTELEYAYNQGADQGIRQAQADGLLGRMKKRWITSGDDAVCDVCAALDGTEVDMDGSFYYPGRTLFSGQNMLPPAHPRCACAVQYLEVKE